MGNGTAPNLPDTEDDLTVVRIGGLARAIREDHGWSASELARRVGIAPPVVEAIEEGSRRPTIGVLYRLAAALQVPPGELLPSAWLRPRVDLHLPLTDEPGSSLVQIIGGGPGNPTQTYLFDLRAGEGDGGFGAHPGTELLVVTDGEVVVSELDAPDEIVGSGRSRAIATDVPHAIRAADSGPARFILVCTDA